jgi:hypothetical protein
VIWRHRIRKLMLPRDLYELEHPEEAEAASVER